MAYNRDTEAIKGGDVMRKFFVFVVGFLVGVWTGGMLSLLFAPEPGSELQLRIREGVDELVKEGRSADSSRRGPCVVCDQKRRIYWYCW